MKNTKNVVSNTMSRIAYNILVGATVCATLSSCAPSTMSPKITDADALKEVRLQKEIAVKENNKQMQRLQNVARPILVNNAPLCGEDISPYVGILTHSKSTLPKEYEDVISALYGVGEYPTVVLMADKSPASKVMQLGDMITHINGEALKPGKAGHQKMNDILDEMQGGEAMEMTVIRDGVAGAVTVKTDQACDYQVLLANGDSVNAYADGNNVFITTGMMRFVESNEELALVIGHELAHNSRGHMDAKRSNAIIGGLLGAVVTVATGVDVTSLGSNIASSAHSQAFEYEADYVGMYHTARAGYNIDNAPALWRRMGASNPSAIHLAGTTHPSTAKRFLALEATAQEINNKRAQNIDLIPEEKDSSADYEERAPNALNN